jgi:hypothetical protein
MRGIVVIFVEAPEAYLPAKPQPDEEKASRADKSPIDNESALPFWTWFIENPRPHSSGSFSSLASLILET